MDRDRRRLTGLLFILMPFRCTDGLFSEGLALLSGLSWGAGIVVAKRFQEKAKMDLLSFTMWQMIFGSIPLVLALPFHPVTTDSLVCSVYCLVGL